MINQWNSSFWNTFFRRSSTDSAEVIFKKTKPNEDPPSSVAYKSSKCYSKYIKVMTSWYKGFIFCSTFDTSKRAWMFMCMNSMWFWRNHPNETAIKEPMQSINLHRNSVLSIIVFEFKWKMRNFCVQFEKINTFMKFLKDKPEYNHIVGNIGQIPIRWYHFV